LRIGAAAFRHGRRKDQLANQIGMADGDLQAHDRLLAIRRSAVALFFDRDHAPASGEYGGSTLPKATSIVEPPPWSSTSGMPSDRPWSS
jgi:hypothetical protein